MVKFTALLHPRDGAWVGVGVGVGLALGLGLASESGSALAHQASESALDSALVTDSESHSASDSAQALESARDSGLVQVSEPASGFPSAPDSADVLGSAAGFATSVPVAAGVVCAHVAPRHAARRSK